MFKNVFPWIKLIHVIYKFMMIKMSITPQNKPLDAYIEAKSPAASEHLSNSHVCGQHLAIPAINPPFSSTINRILPFLFLLSHTRSYLLTFFTCNPMHRSDCEEAKIRTLYLKFLRRGRFVICATLAN